MQTEDTSCLLLTGAFPFFLPHSSLFSLQSLCSGTQMQGPVLMTSPKVSFLSYFCNLQSEILWVLHWWITCYAISAGTKFERLIPDEGPAGQDPGHVKRAIFCTGKVYYELAKERKQQNLEKEVAIIRIEQVLSRSPLPEMVIRCGFCNSFVFICSHRSLLSLLTWPEKKQRSTLMLSWSGVRKSTRIWVTMTTSGHVSSQCWTTRSPFGRFSV